MMISTRRLALGVSVGLAAALVAPAAIAQTTNWPERPVRVVIPYPAGGAIDVMVRALSVRLSKELGQPIVVEARPGGNSNIGAEVVSSSPADGYTLLASSPWFSINQLVENGRRWKPTDFAPIAQYALSPNYMVVGADSPAKTVADYVAMAKKTPGQLYGSTGIGSTQDLAVALFADAAGVRLEAVPYKGAPPILPDLVAGRLSMAIVAGGNASAQIAAGKLRALASTASTRSPTTPDIPTFAEAGYPGVNVVSWYGLHAPAGTPAAVIDKLARAVKVAVDDPETQARFKAANAEAQYRDTAGFTTLLTEEIAGWSKAASLLERK